jgi:hypothetical protein
MTIHLQPNNDVPLTSKKVRIPSEDFMVASANTALYLSAHGTDIEPNSEDKEIAAIIVSNYAEDPELIAKKVKTKQIKQMTPASLVLTSTILKQYAHAVVENSKQLRHLVTNKLIVETENPDPRVRIRALELLGKISDVGLFAEKTEITVTHQTTDDIKDRLRSKLTRLINPGLEDAVVINGDVVDLDDELGPKKEIYDG